MAIISISLESTSVSGCQIPVSGRLMWLYPIWTLCYRYKNCNHSPPHSALRKRKHNDEKKKMKIIQEGPDSPGTRGGGGDRPISYKCEPTEVICNTTKNFIKSIFSNLVYDLEPVAVLKPAAKGHQWTLLHNQSNSNMPRYPPTTIVHASLRLYLSLSTLSPDIYIFFIH